jgi:hypothetical protein
MVATATPTNDQLVKALQVGKREGELVKQVQQQNAMGEILKIVSNNLREPNPEDPAYRDKKLNERYKQINNPQRPTEGQLLGEKKPTYTEEGPIDTGELAPDGSRLMIKGNPLDDATLNQGKFRNDARQRKIRNLVNEGATEGEKEAAKGKLKDQTDLPNFLQNINIKPQDLLKILQLIPAATGFNLQMADKGSSRDQLAMNPAALDALRKGTTPGLSSQEIRSLIKPFTKPDQFGHPTGSLRV